jgi:LuxR family transcriptional regulator, maltose regulon positive regulatory protein
VPLSRALRLAEEEGYVRLFVDEGTPMAELLAQGAERRAQSDPIRIYAERLLSAFPAEQRGEMSHPSEVEAVLRFTLERSNALVEPLTQRERDVLRLLETELSGPEIARELTVGLSTVRTYTKSIYRKLNVNSRRAAVKRASELDLL